MHVAVMERNVLHSRAIVKKMILLDPGRNSWIFNCQTCDKIQKSSYRNPLVDGISL